MKLRIQCLDWIMANRTKGKLNLDKVAEFVKAFKKSVFEFKKQRGEERALYETHFKKLVAESAAKVDLGRRQALFFFSKRNSFNSSL